jgi:thiosulfate/3-mercaptopyruvate sulfurtransferase
MTEHYRHPEALVDTDWLDRHRHDDGLRVFECTTYLDYLPEGSGAAYEVRSGRADFEREHIAGAGFLDLQEELSDPTSPRHLRFTMPPAEDLAESFGRRGIGDGIRAVLYSRGSAQWATRVWWMLRSVGFDDAAVLDGGWEKWEREGRAVSTEEPSFPPVTLTARPLRGIFVGRESVRAAMGDPDVCTINALAAELHRGEIPRYGRPGRIPGSVNVPATSLVDPQTNTFVAAERATATFRAAGADPAGSTLLYCGGGIAATLDAFLLYQLGHERLTIYDASMSEWARDEELPIETG